MPRLLQKKKQMKFDELLSVIEEGSAIRKYSCLMLDCSFLKEEIIDIQDAICPCEVYDDEPGRGLETEPHITVMYGIDGGYKPYEVYHAIDLAPVDFKIKSLSLFENEKFDVLKFDIISKDLHDLHNQVDENLDCCGNSYPNYHPHMTVAYLKPGTGKYYTKLENDLTNKKFRSDIFIFSDPNSDKVIWKAR